MVFVVPIVEGSGEIDALPALLHRIRIARQVQSQLDVNPPIRVKSGSFLNDPPYFERYLQLAAAKAAQRQGSILILLDCEDSCPAELGPKLLRDATALRPDVPSFVALAWREYETWFLAAARSLRGLDGLPADLVPPANPEHFRDAKGWLGDRMPGRYDPIRHQSRFSKRMDLDAARTAQSFDRLYRYMIRLFEDENPHP